MSKARRAIGSAGDSEDEYAVYPDYETGHEALVVMLRGSVYSPLTLKEASLRYVFSNKNHIHKIVKISRLDPDRTIKSLSDKEFELYWKAMEQNEGWEVGDEDFIEKWIISGVHKKRGKITEYLLNQSGKNRSIMNHLISSLLLSIIITLETKGVRASTVFGIW